MEPRINLTPRQRECLEGLREGLPTKAIAERLGISVGTCKIHLAALYRVLRVPNRTAAAMHAVEQY